MGQHSPANKYALVIFDMDGTLTEELLDFAAIRREIGLPEDDGILEHIGRMDKDAQRQAQKILEKHENVAAETCCVHDGAAEVLSSLHASGIRTGLLTRNSATCAERILSRHGLVLDYVATREDLPHKPHPDSILNIARRFGVSAGQTLMVGDYLYDLQAAAAAGTDCAILCVKEALPLFAREATYCIRRLEELLKIVMPEQGEHL